MSSLVTLPTRDRGALLMPLRRGTRQSWFVSQVSRVIALPRPGFSTSGTRIVQLGKGI